MIRITAATSFSVWRSHDESLWSAEKSERRYLIGTTFGNFIVDPEGLRAALALTFRISVSDFAVLVDSLEAFLEYWRDPQVIHITMFDGKIEYTLAIDGRGKILTTWDSNKIVSNLKEFSDTVR
ncbi:hypothetical protein [Agrobacterium leguminum]|jgi:hypothetical protein